MREPDSWITINGQHVPIFEGETRQQATSRFLKNKMSRVQKNKDKYDTIDNFKRKKASNKLEEKPKKIKKMIQKDNKYIVVREGEDEKDVVRDYERRNNPDNMEQVERKRSQDNIDRENQLARRENLIKFMQNNREQVDQWVKEYDDETHKRVGEKVLKGEPLTAKEYFGYLGSDLKPGSVVLEEFHDKENAVVAKDGNWVRQSRIKEYNKNPKANQDAVLNPKVEGKLWEEDDRKQLENYIKKYGINKENSKDREAFKKFKKENPQSNINFVQFIENNKIKEYTERRKTNK